MNQTSVLIFKVIVIVSMVISGCADLVLTKQPDEQLVQPNIKDERFTQLISRTIPWRWKKSIYNNDTVKQPPSGVVFQITFNADKTFVAITDCNPIRGTYVVKGGKLSFDKNMASTKWRPLKCFVETRKK